MSERLRACGVSMWRARFLLARRFAQLGALALFFGTAHGGWTIAGQPLLQGNFSAAKLAGVAPLADPFALLQIVATGYWRMPEAWLGAAIVLVVYLLVGGRAFCAWMCPLNAVTDAAAWVRERIGLRDRLSVDARTRYILAVLALVLSAATGVTAFEWVSPIGLAHRAIVYGALGGGVAVAGVFLLDVAVIRRGWCGRLCPLGAFWSLVNRAGLTKVRFDAATCTRCGDCVKVCPEPAVLNFPRAFERGVIDAGACTSCGQCIAACPEKSLAFGVRPLRRAPLSSVSRGMSP